MQTVIETPSFLRAAKAAKLDEAEIKAIIDFLAANPLAGDLMAGAGGVRKVRFAREGAGKSGGYRTIHYYHSEDMPIFLLGLINKVKKENLTMAETNQISVLVPVLLKTYGKV